MVELYPGCCKFLFSRGLPLSDIVQTLTPDTSDCRLFRHIPVVRETSLNIYIFLIPSISLTDVALNYC